MDDVQKAARHLRCFEVFFLMLRTMNFLGSSLLLSLEELFPSHAWADRRSCTWNKQMMTDVSDRNELLNVSQNMRILQTSCLE